MRPVDLDEADQTLLRFLRGDARTPTAELARRLGVSRSTVQARLEKLERAGVIGGYTIVAGAAVDPGVIRATVMLQVEPRATIQSGGGQFHFTPLDVKTLAADLDASIE